MQMTSAEPAVETVATAMVPLGSAQVVWVTGKQCRSSARTLLHAASQIPAGNFGPRSPVDSAQIIHELISRRAR